MTAVLDLGPGRLDIKRAVIGRPWRFTLAVTHPSVTDWTTVESASLTLLAAGQRLIADLDVVDNDSDTLALRLDIAADTTATLRPDTFTAALWLTGDEPWDRFALFTGTWQAIRIPGSTQPPTPAGDG